VVINPGRISFFAGMGLMLGVGWFAFPRALYRRIEQPVQFSHRVHTSEKVGLTCDGCHTFTEDGRFAGVPRIEQCAGCHAQAQGNTADEKIVVEKYVTPIREIPWLIYARQPENVYFSHAPHLRLAQLKCESCHGAHGSSDSLRPYEENRISGYSRDIWGRSISRLRNKPWEGMKMDDCDRCHSKQGVTAGCLDCHK
jgi:menaquinone reductase, multiheme cytochrome c subunit